MKLPWLAGGEWKAAEGEAASRLYETVLPSEERAMSLGVVMMKEVGIGIGRQRMYYIHSLAGPMCQRYGWMLVTEDPMVGCYGGVVVL
jgi:hypothetical protein